MKMHPQLDTRGVRGEHGQHKIKRSMRLLLKDMAGLKGTPEPNRGLTTWVPNAKGRLRHPCIGKLYHSHNITSNSSMKLL